MEHLEVQYKNLKEVRRRGKMRIASSDMRSSTKLEKVKRTK